jgi:hypothetical protein
MSTDASNTSRELGVSEHYSTILDEIQQFSADEQASKHISLNRLTAKERSQIYDMMETQYKNELQFEKRSVLHGANKQVALIITKTTAKDVTIKRFARADDTVVEYFCKYTRLPLPLTNHRLVDYYLDLLDPYTNCRATFTQFLQDIEGHGNIHQLNRRINEVLNDILRHINNHPSVKVFINNAYTTEMNFLKSSPFQTRDKLYIKANENKLFISVDINKACYTILKHYHPEVFRNMATWEEFVQSFCNEQPIYTLIHSKPLRERIFGDARLTKRTMFLSEYFVHQVLHEMECSSTDPSMLSGDEVVLSYDPVRFRSMFDRYHGDFFKVLAFRLVKLPKYNYFVKEYFDPLQTIDERVIAVIRREFKCIPRLFLMQCIKQYESKPILEIDRKFSTESSHVATLDESIF